MNGWLASHMTKKTVYMECLRTSVGGDSFVSEAMNGNWNNVRWGRDKSTEVLSLIFSLLLASCRELMVLLHCFTRQMYEGATRNEKRASLTTLHMNEVTFYELISTIHTCNHAFQRLKLQVIDRMHYGLQIYPFYLVHMLFRLSH